MKPSNQLSPWNRRQFVTASARSLLGVSIVPWLTSESLAQSPSPTGDSKTKSSGGQATSVIYLFMQGAMSQLDTFDPKPNSDVQGETNVIRTKVPGIQIGEHLPQTARLMDRLAIVRSLRTQTGAHEQGQYLMRTGYKQIATTRHPSLGPRLQAALGKRNQVLPGSVVIGAGSGHPANGFLGAEYTPVPIGDPSDGLQNIQTPKHLTQKQFDRRIELAAEFDLAFQEKYRNTSVKAYRDLYREAVRLMRSDDLKAFDLTQEDAATIRRYGESTFGAGCMLARRLVEHNVRFVEVALDKWDMHSDLFENLPERAGILDRGLSALITDLEQRGLLETTLVVVATEFGRSPEINARAGRNHHPGAFSCVLAGGGIQGGQVYGATDGRSYAVEESPVSIEDFFATVAHAMGMDPQQEIVSPDGRPFSFSNGGAPVTRLFG